MSLEGIMIFNTLSSSEEKESRELPRGWKTRALATLVTAFISGGTPSTKRAEMWDGSIPWTTSAPIAESDITLSSAQRFITQQGLTESATHLIPNGSLLVSTRVGVGKAVVNLIDVAISQDLTGVILDTTQVKPEFIAYQFKTKRIQSILNGYKRGTTIQGISRFDLQNLEFDLPPLAEQQAIVQALQAIQATIEIRRGEIELERERKAVLMQNLFSHGIHKGPRSETEIGEMPQHWSILHLGEVLLQTQYGLSKLGGSAGSFPILRMNNLAEGKITTSDLQYVDLSPNILQKFLLREGDILFNRTNSYELVGKTAIFDVDGIFVFASYLLRVVTDSKRLLPSYLNFYMNWGVTQQRLKMLATRGVSQSNINANKLRQFIIAVPPVSEQVEVVTVLEAFDKQIMFLKRELALLEELFRTLLEELMTGRISTIPLIEEECAS